VSRRYQVDPDGAGCFPIDAALGLDDHGVSPGAREVSCRFGIQDSFKESAAIARRYVGVTVEHEFMRTIVEREGEKITQMRNRGELGAEFTAADAVVDAKKDPKLTRLYTGVDGAFAPMVTAAEKKKRRVKHEQRRETMAKAGAVFAKPLSSEVGGYGDRYKEMKLVTFYNQDKSLMHVAATGGDCNEAGLIVAIHAAQVKLREAIESISLTDGAVWIILRLKEILPRLTAMLLDCFHLKEHIHLAAVAQFGKTEEAGQWTRERIREFKELSVADALGALMAAKKATRKPAAKKELESLIGYVTPRIAMLGYRDALSKGWDIGSGPTEAQCKTSLTRLKISGAKWNAENAPKVLNLIAMRNSGQWGTYWRRLAA
jgi:hypothetical protein